ncbi:PEGA domain-containing protein [bacterium]|nr:PEGA domain-containing protein [bacterium]
MSDHETAKNSFLKKLLLFWIVFVLLASVLGTLLVLYSLGYRYDFKNKKIVLVSVAYINSRPQGAEIYLEGKKIGETKLTLPGITPGNYHFSLKKDEFYEWSANINIEPYSLIEISPALFYQKPETTTSVKFDKLLATKKSKILYQKKNAIFLQDINSEATAEKITFLKGNKVVFSSSSDYLVNETEKEWIMFNGSKKSIISKPKTTIKKWLISNKGEIYFLNQKNELWLAKEQKTEKLYSDIKDFDLKQNKLWVITKKGKFLLKGLTTEALAEKTLSVTNDSLAPIEIASLSFCNFENISQTVCLYNQKGYFVLQNKKLYWLGKDIKSLTEKDNLLAWLNAEGDIYIFKNEQTQFINRYFDAPLQINFFSPEHLILQYAHSIKILELETKQEFKVFSNSQKIVQTEASSEKEILIITNNSAIKSKITEASSLWQKVLQTFRK